MLPGAGVISKVDSGPECESLVKEVVVKEMGSELAGLHMKGVLQAGSLLSSGIS